MALQSQNIVASHLRRVFANSMAMGQCNGTGKRGKEPPTWRATQTQLLDIRLIKLFETIRLNYITQGGAGTPQYIGIKCRI